MGPSSLGTEVRIVRAALIGTDSDGRLAPESVPGLRAAVAAIQRSSRQIDHPADLFGRWESLPSGVALALRDMVASDMRAAARLSPSGSLWTGAVRACWEANRHLVEVRHRPGLRRHLVRSAGRLHDGPLHAWRRGRAAWHRRRWERSPRPGVADLVSALGRDARWLIGDFVEGVEPPARAPGFLDDRRRNVVHGYHLGLDLLATNHGICCLEVNVRPGLGRPRILPRGENPLPRVACRVARSIGARRLVWVESRNRPVPDWVADDLTRLAPEAGLQLEILEDPCMARRPGRTEESRIVGGYRRLDSLPSGSFVLNRDQGRSGPDHLLAHKEATLRALQGELSVDSDRGFIVLPMTRDPVLPPAGDPGFPNLVYKYPDTDSGLGIFFLRAHDTDHAVEMARRLDRERSEPPGLFQPFIPCTFDRDRRVWDVRAEILLTPRGVHWVRGFRRDAARPAPSEIDPGIVRETGVYAANISAGGRLSDLTATDEPPFRAASLAVGEVLRLALARTFVTVR